MSPKLPLQTLRVHNFKAIQDSGIVRFTPLTVLIGGNGSGKSSLIEALETYQAIVATDLNTAMQRWRGFQYVLNQAVKHLAQTPAHLTPTKEIAVNGKKITRIRTHEQRTLSYLTNPLAIAVEGRNDEKRSYGVGMDVTSVPGDELLFIQSERVYINKHKLLHRNDAGAVFFPGNSADKPWNLQYELPAGESVISPYRRDNIEIKAVADSMLRWHFAALNPLDMGAARPRRMTGGAIQLQRDGANLAEYLLDIYQKDPLAFDGIVETMKEILPYVRDLRPSVLQDLNRSVLLEMTEQQFRIPGWMLSTGTLRIVGLLALLRHPTPPPLIVIEELENGLDPRTVHLLVEEIKYAVESGRTQIIVTTHSPYLLDLLSLQHIVLVERVNGAPVFSRPANEGDLGEWSRRFGAGQLYTMGKLRRESQG